MPCCLRHPPRKSSNGDSVCWTIVGAHVDDARGIAFVDLVRASALRRLLLRTRVRRHDGEPVRSRVTASCEEPSPPAAATTATTTPPPTRAEMNGMRKRRLELMWAIMMSGRAQGV